MKKRTISRRNFLKTTAVLLAPTIVSAKALGLEPHSIPASERVTMGMIGVGKQGRLNTLGFLLFPEAQIVAACDIVENHANMAAKMVNEFYGNTDCRAYWDFRELLARPDIDAVFIGTTAHWHAYLTINAMKHGKDVYCEKPETHSIRDGILMREAARRYERVFSGGSQRVWNDYNLFHKIIRAGLIGDVLEGYQNSGDGSYNAYFPGEPIPPGVHWDMFVGPAPYRPYSPAYIGTEGAGVADFCSGSLGLGAHSIGGVMFAMQLQHTGPVKIIPACLSENGRLTLVFKNGQKIIQGAATGSVQGVRKRLPGSIGGLISFLGTEGPLTEWDIQNERYPVPDIDIPNYRGPILRPEVAANLHYDSPLYASVGKTSIHGDFLHCCKTRETPFRNIEACHRVCTAGHLGHIATYFRREIHFDPVTERIIGDPEAAVRMDVPRRAQWEI